ncbi:MAG: transcriptional regulator [Desulfobacterales bacterium]|nr:transcriptional regulator [Desulfobacterales bacterium]MCP4163773.1 transcriptional regulator [Deltaproteobacteria bacterium]
MLSKKELIKIFTEIDDVKKMEKVFEELFTPREVADISLRWQLMKDLYNGDTQRNIAKKYKISLCKITRGSKILKQKKSAVRDLIEGFFDDKEL